tara:strand:+ start:245 stop:643 length:399 start_codon:yes stop_codon:yes gene_type:complete
MKTPKYKKWVKNLKEGDIVMYLDGKWSEPVMFLSFNGDSSSSGYRAQHVYIPNWTIDSWNFLTKDNPQEHVDAQWNSTLTELEKQGLKSRSFTIASVNARAEERYLPYPIEFLTKNQLKFIKIINKLKGYEY